MLTQESDYFAKCILNKPKKLNALDNEMVKKIYDQVPVWNKNKTKLVWFEGAGPKAFSAGSDIMVFYNAYQKNQKDVFDYVNRDEYTLDYDLATMKPFQISIFDGIVMGGGAGIAMNSRFKIATEKSMFAMPGK